MKINKAYKFRLYPTEAQIKYIEGCFNACRYVYNVSLDCEQQLYLLGAKSNLSAFGLNYHLKYYKISSPWLKEYDSCAFVYEMENLANAYQKFFKKEGSYPKFKRKIDKQSFRTRGAIELFDNHIKIPKVNSKIFYKKHNNLIVEGKIKQFTISRENNQYYVSVMTEFEKDIQPVQIKKEVGIDFGVKSFLTFDNGEKVDNPKFLKDNSEHLQKLSQAVSRKVRGSKNHIKAKQKKAKLDLKIKNKRNYFLHNVSTDLVRNYDRIYMEDLNIKGMSASAKGTVETPGKNVAQKSGLNKAILDTGFGMFQNMISYKTKFSGKEVVKVNRFFASSKICSNCGNKNTDLKLSDRIWTCSNCNESLDRDENAAKNIKAEGRRSLIKK